MDAENLGKLIFGLIGGLGLFLLGMKNMSEGMQAVAGSSLRKMIAAVTSNRFLATGAGAGVTCVVQSSSVTTVMVIGFVNSGVMHLSQAIPVIMGANIGTTITGVILAASSYLKIGKYGLPLLGIGAICHLFLKGDRWRYWAMFFMGVGMVFFGLELMKDACSVIKKMPDFNDWFQMFQANNYLGVLKCAMAGCILTMVVQSSSATLGITIALASDGIIPFETAAALVLGENIGTTITAYLASLGATTNARRAAYFHVIFNMVGVFWITLIFQWYIVFIKWVVPLVVPGNDVTTKIAATHIVFNVANTLMFLPFVSFFTVFLVKLVPPKEFKEKPRLTDLDVRMLETPMMAIEQSRAEILKMSEGCEKMLDWLAELREQDEYDTKLADRLRHRENVLDTVQDEVTDFVTGLLSGNVPHSVAEEGRRQLRMADEYESISDYVDSLLRFDRKLRKNDLRFPERHREGLAGLHALVAEYVHSMNAANRSKNPAGFLKLDGLTRQIRKTEKSLRKTLLEELSTETTAPQISVAFLASLNSYARVRDHAQNIGEVISINK